MFTREPEKYKSGDSWRLVPQIPPPSEAEMLEIFKKSGHVPAAATELPDELKNHTIGRMVRERGEEVAA